MEARPAMPDLRDLRLFDSCVTLGRFPGNSVDTADDLLALMDRHHIHEALVHDYHARSVVPIANGNSRVTDAVKNSDRLHPVWILEPPEIPGEAAAETVVTAMLAADVRAARLCMRRMGPVPWMWADLLARLEAHRVPTFFDFGTSSTTIGELRDYDADAIYTMAKEHPGLPVILSRVMGGLGVHPAVPQMVRRLPNLYIDITAILNYWRTAAVDASPEKVLFASGLPFSDPSILVSNVQYAMEIDTTAKKLICGDNLRRLLGGVV